MCSAICTHACAYGMHVCGERDGDVVGLAGRAVRGGSGGHRDAYAEEERRVTGQPPSQQQQHMQVQMHMHMQQQMQTQDQQMQAMQGQVHLDRQPAAPAAPARLQQRRGQRRLLTSRALCRAAASAPAWARSAHQRATAPALRPAARAAGSGATNGSLSTANSDTAPGRLCEFVDGQYGQYLYRINAVSPCRRHFQRAACSWSR